MKTLGEAVAEVAAQRSLVERIGFALREKDRRPPPPLPRNTPQGKPASLIARLKASGKAQPASLMERLKRAR